MGDADAKDELAFERRVEPELLHPLILKVSHHGSRTSTPEELLRKLRPQRAWVSCGVGNHFGHPTARVIELLERLRIPIERTDREGSLDSRFRHSQVKPSRSGNRSDE